MIRVMIGNAEREARDIDMQWIKSQIEGRRADGVNVCVRVSIHTSSAQFTLATPTCGGGGGGARALNPEESDILRRWEQLHLNTSNFTSGNLSAFLKQIT